MIISYLSLNEIIDLSISTIGVVGNLKDEIYTYNDIFIIKKNNSIVDIFCSDKLFLKKLNEIIKNRKNVCKNIFTRSMRCYIIDIEEIKCKLDYNEFKLRYKGSAVNERNTE